ncbi:MAG: hypothetical protein ABW039_07665 [Sphingobium sp.]
MTASKLFLYIALAMAASPAMAQYTLSPDIPNDGDNYIGFLDPDGVALSLALERYDQVGPSTFRMEHLSLNNLDARYPGLLQGTPSQPGFFAYFSRTNIAGVEIRAQGFQQLDADYADIEIYVPCLSSGVRPSLSAQEYFSRSEDMDVPYGIQFPVFGGTYADAYAAFQSWLDGGNPPTNYFSNQRFTGAEFREGVYGCSVTTAGVNPLVGNPQSLQYQQVQDGLDFSTPSLEADDTDWGLGGRIGHVQRAGRYGTQFDVRLSRSFRVAEGSRTLVTVDVPVSYQTVGGQKQWKGYVAVGAAIPVTQDIAISPRISYGFTEAPEQQIKGQVATASVAATAVKPNMLGRGSLTVGGMVGYSKVTHVEFAGRSLNTKTDNISFRGGLAGDWPLDAKLLGRAGSVRTSYAFTLLTGDNLYADKVHELTASVGVRSRGTELRNAFEMMRIGLIARFAHGSNAGHAFIGYRF